MRRFIGVISSLLCATYCQSALAYEIPDPTGQWLTVAMGTDNTVYQVDTGIYRKGTITGFWVQSHSTSHNRTATYLTVDCSSKEYQTLTQLHLNSDGVVMAKDSAQKSVFQAQYGTVAAELFKAVCGK